MSARGRSSQGPPVDPLPQAGVRHHLAGQWNAGRTDEPQWEAPLTRRSFWAIALLLAGFLAVTADVLLSGPLTRLDWVVHVFVEHRIRGAWWVVSDVLAYAGNQYVLVAALGATCLAVAARYRTLRPILVVFVVCGTLAVVVPGIKVLTGRTPPHTEVDLVFTFFTEYRNHDEYPSGHAVNAIVIWGVFLELLRSASRRVERLLPPRVRNGLIVVATAAAGLGMVGMDYHWLSDVIAGWLLGTAILVGFLDWNPVGPIRCRRDRAAGSPPRQVSTAVQPRGP